MSRCSYHRVLSSMWSYMLFELLRAVAENLQSVMSGVSNRSEVYCRRQANYSKVNTPQVCDCFEFGRVCVCTFLLIVGVNSCKYCNLIVILVIIHPWNWLYTLASSLGNQFLKYTTLLFWNYRIDKSAMCYAEWETKTLEIETKHSSGCVSCVLSFQI